MQESPANLIYFFNEENLPGGLTVWQTSLCVIEQQMDKMVKMRAMAERQKENRERSWF